MKGGCWDGGALQVLMRRLGTFVQMLASKVPELKGIETRSEAMVTCCKDLAHACGCALLAQTPHAQQTYTTASRPALALAALA